MVWTTKKGKKVEYHGGGKERIHLQVTTSVLAELFKTTKRTIRRWIKTNKLNPHSLEEIVNKYNNIK